MTKKINIPLILILFFSLLIRLYKIDNLSLFGDEIDVGSQAYSLLQNGHDYKGNFLPFYIQSLSESRAPLLIYSTIPTVALFGLNEIGVRLPSIIFGVLSLYLFYKLVYLLSKSSSLSIYSTLALSFTPWHFHYSRSAFEITLLLSLILLGTYFSYIFIDQNKKKLLYLAVIFFSLSFYTYNTSNIFVPLIIISIFLTNSKKIIINLNPKTLLFVFSIFLIITLPLLQQIFFGSAANRFNLISIFHNQNLIDQVVTKRTIFSASSPNIESIFHNKPIAWINEFSKNYLSSLSLPFLFIYGDQSNLRHTIPGFGLIFLIYLPFFIFGLFQYSKQEKLSKIMFLWLIISPIASSLTIGGGTHATRLFLTTIPLAYFTALGLKQILSYKNIFNRLFLFLCSIILIFQIIGYSHEYFVHYPKDSFEVWNYGYKEIFQSIPQTDQNIYISNAKYNSLLPFYFYQKYSTNNGFLDDSNQKNIISNFSGFKVKENIFFINDFIKTDHLNAINQIAQPGDVFLLFQIYDIPGNMDFSKKSLDGYKTIKTVYNPNDTILGQIIQKI